MAAQVIAFRPDADSEKALDALTKDGKSTSTAIREALIAAAELERRTALLREAEALAADQGDREEARRVLVEMESLHAR